MKLKYYLRGMGIGIIVTTLIFTIAWFFISPKMTDAEIIERAEKLGMVRTDGGTIAENIESSPEVVENPDGSLSIGNPEVNEQAVLEEDEAEKPAEEADTAEDKEEEKAEPEKTESEKTETAQAEPETATETKPDNTPGTAQTGKASVTVSSGDTSAVIAGKLKTEGIIEDADAFDEYLRSRGFDSFIQLGTYEINKGASFNEIAEIITQNKR